MPSWLALSSAKLHNKPVLKLFSLSQSITKEHQHNTPLDDKPVISSLSELTEANTWRSSRYSQSNKLYHAS